MSGSRKIIALADIERLFESLKRTEKEVGIL